MMTVTQDEIDALEQGLKRLVTHLKRRRAPQTVVRSAVETSLAIDWAKRERPVRP
jgi:hypothetical protein